MKRAVFLLALLLSAPAAAQENPPKTGKDQLLDRAASALTAGRRDEAARFLRQAADRFGSVHALLQLARLQTGEGNPAAALDTLRRARGLAPNSEDVLSAFAQVSLSAAAPVPAIVTLRALTRMCPTVAQYQYMLGVGLMQAGDMPGAVESLRSADALEPERPLTLTALGLALNARQAYPDAIGFLRRSLALEPENAETLASLSEAEEAVGDAGEAERLATRVLRTVPHHVTANIVLGTLRLKQGRYGEARDALLTAAGSPQAPAKAHYQLSLVYARLGEQASAEAQLALYRQKLEETERRMQELRSATGTPSGSGMQR